MLSLLALNIMMIKYQYFYIPESYFKNCKTVII